MKDTTIPVARLIVLVTSLGFMIGATTAFVEVSILLVLSGPVAVINPSFYFPSMIIYGLVWAICSLLLALAAFAVGRPWGRQASFSFAVTVAVTIFLIAGGYINSRFFPSFLDPQSLIFDAVFLVVSGVLGIYLYIFLVHRGILEGSVLKVWRYVLALTFGAALVMSLTHGRDTGVTEKEAPAPSMPNVLVLLIDTLRSDHLSCYGYDRVTSPNIDRLAEEGAIFLNMYSQASWTKPATASLMTGVYPSTHQTTTMGSGLMDSFRILPEVFHENGFRTAILTSNNLISPLFGFDQGVDFFHYGKAQMVRELMLGNIIRTLLRRNQERKMKVEDVFWRVEAFFRFTERVDYDPSAEALNMRFLEWVAEDSSRPFFAYIHYIEPHFPYTPPPPFDTLFTPLERGKYIQPEQNYGFQPFDRMDPVEQKLVETVIGEYDGEIAHLDHLFGKFFGEMKKRGFFDDTIVLLTSDHGEEFFEHSMWGHGHSLFDEVVRIPLILRFPGSIQPGIRISSIASLVDVMPTLLSLSGIHEHVETVGRNLQPLIFGVDGDTPGVHTYGEILKGGRRAWFITDGRYKLLKYEKGVYEETMLFDLLGDDAENVDLSDSLKTLSDSLLLEMEEVYRLSSENAVEGKQLRIDKATEDQLKALGYIY